MFTTANLKTLIEKYDDFYLYSLFISNFKIGLISSPLRRGDDNPSFSTYLKNNRIYFKDFGTGHYGDIYEFVSLLYNVSFKKCLDIIYEKINNIDNQSLSQKQYSKKLYNKKQNLKSKFIPVYRTPEKKDILFWSQYLDDLKTLEKFKVFPLKYFIKDGNKYNFKDYVFLVGSRFKFYQPDKSPKYFGNTNSSSIQGWNRLSFNNRKLLLVSSLKEVMCLYEIGIQAIAPNSESTLIPPKIINFLKWYWDIEILYDWDKAGINNAKLHSSIYNIKINKLQYENMNVKDISDFKKKYKNLKQIICI